MPSRSAAGRSKAQRAKVREPPDATKQASGGFIY
jgi:hypothetical protein